MRLAFSRSAVCVPFRLSPPGDLLHAAITVELSEVLPPSVPYVDEEFYQLGSYWIAEGYGGVDPLDTDCPLAGKCIGLLTRV